MFAEAGFQEETSTAVLSTAGHENGRKQQKGASSVQARYSHAGTGFRRAVKTGRPGKAEPSPLQGAS